VSEVQVFEDLLLVLYLRVVGIQLLLEGIQKRARRGSSENNWPRRAVFEERDVGYHSDALSLLAGENFP
jgi:hypothetical protein